VKLIIAVGGVNITRGHGGGAAVAVARDEGGVQVVDQRVEECGAVFGVVPR
jgi:hypothetical protein